MDKPWLIESTQVNWEAHGLKCTLRRGPFGSWCGYVAVPKEHVLHGKTYSELVKVSDKILNRNIDIDKVGVINLFCAAASSDVRKERLLELVLAVDVHGGLTYSDKRCPRNEPDGSWWFGFDAGHAGDYSPKLSFHLDNEVYRTEEYMIEECENLAKQLAQWGKEDA